MGPGRVVDHRLGLRTLSPWPDITASRSHRQHHPASSVCVRPFFLGWTGGALSKGHAFICTFVSHQLLLLSNAFMVAFGILNFDHGQSSCSGSHTRALDTRQLILQALDSHRPLQGPN